MLPAEEATRAEEEEIDENGTSSTVQQRRGSSLHQQSRGRAEPEAATARDNRPSSYTTVRQSEWRRSSIGGRGRATTRASALHAEKVLTSLTESHNEYKWRMHAPKRCDKFLYWLVTGHSEESPASDQESKMKIRNLARALVLLRAYQAKFGMPVGGGPREQEWVLQELCKRLFFSGVPIWVLQPVMGIAARGLTGVRGFGFFLLPSSGIIIPPHDAPTYSTEFFQTQKSFCMYQLDLYEKVLARLSSFSTNTRTINSVKEDFLPRLLMKDESISGQQDAEIVSDREACAEEILDLASRGYGLFFLTRVEELLMEEVLEERFANEDIESGDLAPDGDASVLSYHSFWNVDDSLRELFGRLATIEALECLDAIDRLPSVKDVWPRRYVALFRAVSSAGSSGLWFNGSWWDMLLAGGLAGTVALVFHTNEKLWSNQRMVFEVFVSYTVGLAAGLITIRLPESTCFSAIAIASMIDYLRGFGIVFSIMEVMSKNTMAGSSDLIEALVFSFLISLSILFGLGTAEGIWNVDVSSGKREYMQCREPLNEMWFLLLCPIASIGWTAVFRPAYKDIPLMAFHGIIAFAVSWVIDHWTDNSYLGSFIAALTTSTMAGLLSRFTGRQALGDTFTGLYALVPGIYITESFFKFALEDTEFSESAFFFSLALRAIIIGVGSWCGTLLCAPTNLGTNSGILSALKSGNGADSNLGAMLYI